VPHPSASPKSPGGLPLFFGVSPPPTEPLFIAAARQEAGSSVGNNGGKGSGKKSGGTFLAGESGGKAVVSLARGGRASDWRYRKVPALPIGSCRTGAGTGVPAHLLGSPTRQHDFGDVEILGLFPIGP
jgi:hypothetical protein